MVALFLKKKLAGGSDEPSKRERNRDHPNQMVDVVSPFEEFLPSEDMFRFKKSFKMARSKHSIQRDQLAKLKAREILKTTETTQREIPTKKKTVPTFRSHEGTKRNQPAYPVMSSDLHVPNGVGYSVFPHQVPDVISIKRLDESNEDASSEISLEEVFQYMSSLSGSSGAAPSLSTELSESPTWANDGWSYPAVVASATKSCLPTTLSDLESSDSSSISWPSDEYDGITSSGDESGVVNPTGTGPLDRKMLFGTKKPTACAYDDGSEYFKSELTCGGFKFWSGGEIHMRNLGETGMLKAARDEEDCRRAADYQEEETRV
ncbi:expressed unknown protein [Seminavis robusta]|uniref:Uncharacterized protein n=1 Tax=Seminavis robusta TaxID=568900 RepID=A0A9N8E0F6_9STRA|nr:expressed unknown protein [Seminavis robusta]|eukprot:Sro525_g160220.1 n/a (319) ;mRNA; f:55218-56174